MNLSKISVKYAKICQNIRQISLNFSQNFVPCRPRAERDASHRREPPALKYSRDTFGVSETDSTQINQKVSRNQHGCRMRRLWRLGGRPRGGMVSETASERKHHRVEKAFSLTVDLGVWNFRLQHVREVFRGPEPPTLKSPLFIGRFSPEFRPFYAILRQFSPSWRQEAGNRKRTVKRRRKTGEKVAEK